MTKVLKHGDIFYCRSQNGSYKAYKFINIVTNHKKNKCNTCPNKGSKYCCYMNYSIRHDENDKQSICLKSCIDIMYHDEYRSSRVKYIENIFEPQDDDIVTEDPTTVTTPTPQLSTVDPVMRATRYRTYTPNFTSAHSNLYSNSFATANLETSQRFRAVFTGQT